MEEIKKNRALTPKMLAERLSIGRDKAYSLMRSAGFPSIKLGDRYIVTEDALERWLRVAEGKYYDLEEGRFVK
ncbi:MAG: helix-turn-helix domain-containing protein [Lachnospiraceae bacterium]|nr:helix-turn-helix domain-containing protein [Lachnospiraceae bacterium]